MRLLAAFGLALALLLPAAPAMSETEAGSHGWSRETLVLRTGPGTNYDITGEIPGEVAIKILRCQKLWCNVDGPGGRGWTNAYSVDFGKDPHWPILDSDNDWPDVAGGSMCFYEGTNFTGRSFCANTGEVFQDLATWGWDNRIRSIAVTTPTSAAICRDRFFQSYCERILESEPHLDPLLASQLSSIRVY
ncbi:peptidase inhibitor family I36 protein [Devosia sediminis]|uniref:Peptidase inhibitor family I36 protein n=1 Tax=Devosia sediminis TaxID=2798801 RepID=A0A934IV21_9HYPH|nr:peptidase inhibitor family I36 protein [Devosia sediminis]MBJ3783505.1 peptidase inhibitor family I36 protein [Devosia sediminis]